MAVAQAQHKLRELYDALMKRGVDVQVRHSPGGRTHARSHERAACRSRHPVRPACTRWKTINSEFPQCDVALVIGANDVTNPAARHDKIESDLWHADSRRRQGAYGDGDQALMNPGFAGIDNELYYMDKTLMLFGDAKSFVTEIIKELPAAVRA